MAAALKRLRDSLELQQFIQDAEDVCCLNCLLFVVLLLIFRNVLNALLPRCINVIAYT